MSIAMVVGDLAYVDTRLVKGRETFAAFGKAMAFKSPIPVKFHAQEDVLYGLVGSGPTEAIQAFRTLIENQYHAMLAAEAPESPIQVDLETTLEAYQSAHALGLFSAVNMMDIALIGFEANHLFTVDDNGAQIATFTKSAVLGGGSGGVIARRAISDEGYTPLRAVFNGCYQDPNSGGVIEQWGLAWTVDQGDRIGYFSDLKFMHLGLSHSRTSEQLRDIIAHATEPMAMDLLSQQAIVWHRHAPSPVSPTRAAQISSLSQLNVKADPADYVYDLLPASFVPKTVVPVKKVSKPFIRTFFRRRLYKETPHG